MTTNKVQLGDSTANTSTSVTYRSNPPTEYGWVCPRCDRVNAPWKSQCDCAKNNWNLTWDYPSTDDWWKRVYCDSDTFRIHPETTTWKTPSSVCQSDSTVAKLNPNEKIEVWSNSADHWSGSDYWDEEKKCWNNIPTGLSNSATSINSLQNQYFTLTSDKINELQN